MVRRQRARWTEKKTQREQKQPENLLTYREAADLLRVCERTLRNRVNDGEIPVVRIGKAVRFSREFLEGWIAAQLTVVAMAAEQGFSDGES